MASLVITAQDLLDKTNDKLGGYGNVLTPAATLGFINEGKDKIWGMLKTLEEKYFFVSSQFTDNTQNNFFGPLSTTAREYAMPIDFKEIRFIEVAAPSGFEQTEFIHRAMSDPAWKEARRSANVDRTLFPFTTYFYDIASSNMELAQFPEVNFSLILWYIRYIIDLEMDDELDQTLLPFVNKITDWAAKKTMLALQNEMMAEEWEKDWKASVVEITTQASPANQSDPVYVQDFIA